MTIPLRRPIVQAVEQFGSERAKPQIVGWDEDLFLPLGNLRNGSGDATPASCLPNKVIPLPRSEAVHAPEIGSQLADHLSRVVAGNRNAYSQPSNEAEGALDDLCRDVRKLLTGAIGCVDALEAAMARRLISFETEIESFRIALDRSENESLKLSQRLLEIEIALNDRSTEAASVHESRDRPGAAARGAQSENPESAETTQAAALLRFGDLYHRRVGAGRHHDNPDRTTAARGGIAEVERAGAGRSDQASARSVGAMTPAVGELQARLDSQAKQIALLERQLRAGQTAAQRKIDELESELQRERLQTALQADRNFDRRAR